MTSVEPLGGYKNASALHPLAFPSFLPPQPAPQRQGSIDDDDDNDDYIW